MTQHRTAKSVQIVHLKVNDNSVFGVQCELLGVQSVIFGVQSTF